MAISNRLLSTSHPWMPPARSSHRKVPGLCSRVLVPTSSVVLLVPVCSPSTTRCSCSCSARPSRVDLVMLPNIISVGWLVEKGYRGCVRGTWWCCDRVVEGLHGCGSAVVMHKEVQQGIGVLLYFTEPGNFPTCNFLCLQCLTPLVSLPHYT